MPIAWRIPLVIAMNALIALMVGLLGWQSASLISDDIDQLRQVQERGRQLSDIDAQVNRLQSLIRQYLNAPTDEVMKEVSRRSDDLFSALSAASQDIQASQEHGQLGEEMGQLNEAARRFVSGFQQLKSVNAEVARVYETEIVQASGEISGLYSILNASIRTDRALPLTHPLAKAHENFVAAIIAINTFYFSGLPIRADDAHDSLAQVLNSVPAMTKLAASPLQRDTLAVIQRRTARMDDAVETIAKAFDDRARILLRDIDTNQSIMAQAIDRMIARGHDRETILRDQSATLPQRTTLAGLSLGLALLAVGIIASWVIGQSIRSPLLRLHAVMEAGAKGDWTREIDAPNLPDELAAMARTVSVFRRNALDKAKLERERARTIAHQEEAKRRTLHELLEQMEAHEHGAPFSRLEVHETEGRDAAEIAEVFNRVLEKFQHATSERNAAIAQLTQSKEDAEQTSLAKTSFLAAVTHEIRTPLNGMLALLEQSRVFPPGPERDKTMAILRETGLAVLKIVDDVLDFSRLEAGRLILEAVPLDMRRLLDAVLATQMPQAQSKKLRLASFVDPALPAMVVGDPTRLRQILFNLIDNAVKFTSHGHVSVFLQYEAGSGLRLAVADTGIGMDARTLGGLFQPFAQGDASIPHRFGGTGLGLSITQRLVVTMGGEMDAQSRAGAGSVFSARIPLAAWDDGTAVTLDADLMGLRLLVLSPDSTERSLIARLTEQQGAAVVRVGSAESARAASDRAASTQAPFDLAVISAETFTAMAASHLPYTPFLLIGRPAQGEGLERLEQCRGLLGRPVTGPALLAAIAQASRKDVV